MSKANLKAGLTQLVREGRDYSSFKSLAQQALDDGLTYQEAYNVAEEVWLEFGFNEKSDCTGQDDLEFLLERLWYEYLR